MKAEVDIMQKARNNNRIIIIKSIVASVGLPHVSLNGRPTA
jgi:hypothetical protein